jgi:hypothetical protein
VGRGRQGHMLTQLFGIGLVLQMPVLHTSYQPSPIVLLDNCWTRKASYSTDSFPYTSLRLMRRMSPWMM